jgi:hypothetical protein
MLLMLALNSLPSVLFRFVHGRPHRRSMGRRKDYFVNEYRVPYKLKKGLLNCI